MAGEKLSIGGQKNVEGTTNTEQKSGDRGYFTARQLLHELVNVEDLDAEIRISFFGSDPIPLQNVEEAEDGIVLNGSM